MYDALMLLACSILSFSFAACAEKKNCVLQFCGPMKNILARYGTQYSVRVMIRCCSWRGPAAQQVLRGREPRARANSPAPPRKSRDSRAAQRLPYWAGQRLIQRPRRRAQQIASFLPSCTQTQESQEN